MKIVIPGGSGQVGQVLARSFSAAGHEVVILSRSQKKSLWRTEKWDGATLDTWANEVDGCDVLINLAGLSVNCRYHSANRRAIMDSRVDSTRVVGQSIAQAKRPPRVWLQASTATIYAHRFDAPNDEATGILGGLEDDAPDTWRFSIDVAQTWERVAREAELPGTRLVLMRSAITLSPDRDGVFDTLLGLVRRGLGGTCGDGRQYVSWIHDADFIRAVNWLIERDELSGPINLASPNPLPNAAFMAELRRAWGTRIGLPAPAWLLEIGTFMLRTETELVLKSRRVTPGTLLASGFEFAFPDWSAAAQDLCRRWKENRRTGSCAA